MHTLVPADISISNIIIIFHLMSAYIISFMSLSALILLTGSFNISFRDHKKHSLESFSPLFDYIGFKNDDSERLLKAMIVQNNSE